MTPISDFLYKRKYELLLLALLQHLFIGIFLNNMNAYAVYIWPANMVVLAFLGSCVFMQKGRTKNIIKNILLVCLIVLPIIGSFITRTYYFMQWVSIIYLIFFIFLFVEIVRFLVQPGYINTDIISASICGYLLLIEVAVFLLQSIYYQNPASFKGIDGSGSGPTYMDFVYFSSITITSIGFGDILPATSNTKLLTALFGIVGQFYSVVLVGILISKFTTEQNK